MEHSEPIQMNEGSVLEQVANEEKTQVMQTGEPLREEITSERKPIEVKNTNLPVEISQKNVYVDPITEDYLRERRNLIGSMENQGHYIIPF